MTHTRETLVGRTVLFGKSYLWMRVGEALELWPDYTQRALFPRGERRQLDIWNMQERLAHTGRPSRTPIRAAAVTACAATVLTLAAVLSQTEHDPGEDMAPTPYFSRTSEGTKPYLPTPEPRTSTHTSRDGKRKVLRVERIATPSTTPTNRHPIATPPADIRISFYDDCTGHAQQCIDNGALTMYSGRILAGHNYMGYQWLSRVPVGRTVRVISGPLAGTYRVYGHLKLSRQGGTIPSFGSADLVLQSCEGSGTGFSLLKRV
ncbi:hypothetical protein [Streptomyces sp. NPDC058280]|uniref:hypothetical protein n=1 Tax=Streptomyces sp. NPDC058280 TaxID=3346419 RepID=UPI0036E64E75